MDASHRDGQGVGNPAPPQAAGTGGRRTGGRPTRGILITLLFSLGLSLICLLYAVAVGIQSRPLPRAQVLPTLADPQPEAADPMTPSEIVRKVAPGVVSISLYDAGGITPVATGSGILLSEDGYIATNAHVVHGGSLIRVSLYDGSGYTAQLVGQDVRSDLAVLKIAALGLTPVEFGDSDALEAGQRVYVIGNATGTLPGSITQGLVSGLGRQVPISTIDGKVVTMELIQTDAAVNPGNSGGALVDVYGRVVGITIGKMERENVESVGFALPANSARRQLAAILNREVSAPAPKLGVVCEALNETTGPPNGLPAQGLYILELAPGSGLHAHGVLPGDVLLSADGLPLGEVSDLTRVLQGHGPDDTVTLEVYRFSGGGVDIIEAELYVDG